jgi:ATP-dependent helicase/nuclease subunit B
VGTTNNFSTPAPRQNCFLEALAAACRQELLTEKWLLAPSLRIGHQWLDAVARSGQPVVNVRLKTLKSLALDLSGAALKPDIAGIVLVTRQLAENHNATSGYLFSLPPTLALSQSVFAALRNLSLAGIRDLSAKTCEVPAKNWELRALLRHFHDDYADALRLAMRTAPNVKACVLVPADLELAALEKGLLKALPAVQQLPVEEKSSAPVSFIRAIGEINEVRAVLRRCLAGGIAFDQVELLHTDAGTYLPLIYEELQRLGESATFAEGVPARFSRPGRALAAWLTWQREDFPQATLVQMLGDGLLEWPGELAHTRLASRLRSLPIGFGRRRYRSVLDERRAALEHELPDFDEDGEPSRSGRNTGALEELRWLTAGLEVLLAETPDTQAEWLGAAQKFLSERVRCGTELDNFARHALLERVETLAACVGDEELPAFDVRTWLAALPDEIRVCGSAPMPGRLHVASIHNGGHTRRAHTFILGLDAGRWFNVGWRDPVLLDSERFRLSLPTSDDQREHERRAFDRLLARLAGTITLSYCARNISDGREMFPAEPIPVNDLPAAQSFAPASGAEALDEADWWRWRLCAPGNAEEVAARFPNLARGLAARSARASEAFTAYDGFVPRAGMRAGAMSASGLQTLGECPLRFFFRYVLDIKAPDELEMDADRWLQPKDFGSLLHEVFYRFMRQYVETGRWPSDIQTVLAERIVAWRGKIPPPNESVFRREQRQLQRAARMFERMEAEFCRSSRPQFLETAIGLPPREAPSPLDRKEPVAVKLPDGETLLARGYIDRIDEVGPGRFTIWDYKTFGSSKYSHNVFQQGRILQHTLYLAMAEICLCEKFGAKAGVESFGFFFPGEKGRGERPKWKPEELEEGLDIIAKLCELRARGAFLATTSAKDCEYCDYASCCGDLRAVTAAAAAKLYHPGNTALAPFRDLRPQK